MLYYVYDGSFDGLLTCIHEAYYRKERPEKILFLEDAQENLLVEKRYIGTDKEKARKVYDAIRSKISYNALKNVFYTFLSEREEAGTLIYQYVKLGFKVGSGIDRYFSEDRVYTVHKIVQKVKREAHLMLGLVRFQKLKGNFYYAAIEPEYHILGCIAPHFAKRMADQNWIIHDQKRNIGAVYNQKEWIFIEMQLKPFLYIGEEERLYQKLWQQYFKSIAIKDRSNPKLQRRYMPKRYWKHLIEKI